MKVYHVESEDIQQRKTYRDCVVVFEGTLEKCEKYAVSLGFKYETVENRVYPGQWVYEGHNDLLIMGE